MEENNYYPFGLKHKGYNNVVNGTDHKYGFGGKEEQDELGLNMYDYHARMYDPSLGRMMNIDPHSDTYYGISPYNYAINNPALLIDPDGKDAIVSIKDGVVTVTTNIYIYGSGASKDRASEIQNAINSLWKEEGFKYTDDDGNEFDVVFNTNVEVYDEEDPTNEPMVIPGALNPFSTDNFINVVDGVGRSNVSGGDEGTWYAQGRKGDQKKSPAWKKKAIANTYAHEFGHLVGLKDRYNNGSVADAGYEGQIMANGVNYFSPVVDQRAIDGVVRQSVTKYNKFVKKYGNEEATKSVYTTKIDINSPKN
nr:RHS repeat-associated core domain-containing protein [uncultured Lacinutrix sp.]